MEVKSFTSLEATLLTLFNEGNRTFDALKAKISISEKSLNDVLEGLTVKGVLKLNLGTREYVYDTPVEGDKVILDGNIMLPITVIKQVNELDPTKSKLLVTRGAWYEFPIDFDIRRIIWNVQLPSSTKSTLIDLIRESALKERKSKIIQNPQYQQLVGKLLPWNDKIKLKINVVGDDVADVTIIFVDRLYMVDGGTDFVEYRGLTVRSEVSTKEMIGELQKKPDERRISENVKLNHIFNFSDFLFANNEIPYSSDGESINFARITAIRGKLELTYYRFNNNSALQKLSVEEYIDSAEGIDKLRELFNSYAASLVNSSDILVEMTE
jgi:hypothetical protein